MQVKYFFGRWCGYTFFILAATNKFSDTPKINLLRRTTSAAPPSIITHYSRIQLSSVCPSKYWNTITFINICMSIATNLHLYRAAPVWRTSATVRCLLLWLCNCQYLNNYLVSRECTHTLENNNETVGWSFGVCGLRALPAPTIRAQWICIFILLIRFERKNTTQSFSAIPQ